MHPHQATELILAEENNLETQLSAMAREARSGTTLKAVAGLHRGNFVLDGVSMEAGETAGQTVIFEESGCCLRTRGDILLRGITFVLSRRRGRLVDSAVIVEDGTLQMQDCKVLSKALCGISITGSKANAILSNCYVSGLEFGLLLRRGASCTVQSSHLLSELGYGALVRHGRLVAREAKFEGEDGALWICEGEAQITNCELTNWTGEVTCRVDPGAKCQQF